MADEVDSRQIWKSISSAIDVEIREATTICGVSGQDHPVQAIAVDDKTKRVVIFSAEQSPRIASLMQVDVQATLPDVHVLVARPVVFNISEIARRVAKVIDIQTLAKALEPSNNKRKSRAKQNANEVFGTQIVPAVKPLFQTANRVRLPLGSQVMDIAEQIVHMDWAPFLEKPDLPGFLAALFSMTTIDSSEADRKLGICPIPLYDFSDADYELLLAGRDVTQLRARLKELGIYQYFFPAPDQLLLGLADKHVTKDGSLVLAAEEAPIHGHPLGTPEILRDNASLMETLEELKGRGYVADAEYGIEITDKGREIRQNIKIRPREGLINKLSKIVSIKIDLSLKDFFK
jgi:hypothetical protein